MNSLQTNQSAAIEQRLRFMIARDLSSRGYYLDAEKLYADRSLSDLSTDEIAMLAIGAVSVGNITVARHRLQRLYEAMPEHPSVEPLIAAIGDFQEPSMRAKALVQSWLPMVPWIAAIGGAFLAGWLLRSL